MLFFADTANLKAIQEIKELGILDGVTTNPSLMAKEGIKGEKNILKHYEEICRLTEGDVSAEVIAVDFDGMLNEAHKLAAISGNIVVKIPMTREGLKVIKILKEEGIKTNCTLVFSAGQAILAAKAGATYISPFIGRLDDISQEGIQLIHQIVNIYDIQGYDTLILAASIRHPLHIVQCAEAGADVVTCPPDAILKLLNHPLTDSGLERFLSDFRKSQE
ncbi:MAG: fructose-6-phosphate aldolase [Sphingobacteriales bacterium]|nr:fructose-6-phosphate aldolase [Sphingobacteriales bacterium]